MSNCASFVSDASLRRNLLHATKKEEIALEIKIEIDIMRIDTKGMFLRVKDVIQVYFPEVNSFLGVSISCFRNFL